MVVFEPVIDFETKRLGSRLCGEQGTMAIPTVLAGEDGVQLQRSPVDCEILEISGICLARCDPRDDKPRPSSVFSAWRIIKMTAFFKPLAFSPCADCAKIAAGIPKAIQRAKYQFKSHLSVPVGPKRTSGVFVHWTLHHAKAGVNIGVLFDQLVRRE
jgi:hypothetical protein